MHHPQRSEKKGWELFLFQVDSISHICSLPLLCNGNGDDGNGDNGNGDDGNGDDDDGDDDGDDGNGDCDDDDGGDDDDGDDGNGDCDDDGAQLSLDCAALLFYSNIFL